MCLALFDLDGFKTYNDTFGHPAGDALLARLGRSLREAMVPYGTAYRMGGDEFCVLTTRSGDEVDTVLATAAAALSEVGEGFEITCSYGKVMLPAEAAEAELALNLADARMYVRKNPSLRGHVDSVGRLAEMIGERRARDARADGRQGLSRRALRRRDPDRRADHPRL